MAINPTNGLNIQSLAQSPLRAKQPAAVEGETFNAAAAAQEVMNTVANSERAAAAYMVGKADPHSVVEAIASAEIAVETAVTVRNRVIEAYQELLRMPI